jgi:hypothetical protein
VVAALDPRLPSGTPLGLVVAGAKGQQASGGPRGQPFSQPGPAGRVGPTTTGAGPTGQPFFSLPARFVERGKHRCQEPFEEKVPDTFMLLRLCPT